MPTTDELNQLEVNRAVLRATVRSNGELMARNSELETALNRMVLAHENLASDTEGRYPPLDSGCIECTVGCVPDRYNTGLCAYHAAKRLLGQI